MKVKIRKHLKQQLSSLTDKDVLEKSAKIAIKLLKYSDTYKNKNCLIYKSSKNEVLIDSIEENLISNGNSVFIPKIIDGNSLCFNRLDSNQKLILNKFNILESPSTELIEVGDLDLIILPIVGTDKSGFRLGHGGGYYDRGLEAIFNFKNKPLIIGIGFDFQYTNKNFGEPHDTKLDLMITDKRVIGF